ncbi:MAG TPA: substrate-binding domain-containing protein [Acidimicrobiales bacterium]|nr:substrate-binding domain-containing protein [Acidimicrobiales bacterium]
MVATACVLGAALGIVAGVNVAGTPPSFASAGLIGDGSSFAGPEILSWAQAVAGPPYDLTVNYAPDSSGQGRFDFGSRTVDFAVTDIAYQSVAFDTAQPTFAFDYVPVTAAGVGFMYHLNGLASGTTLQLSSYSICSIFTGGVTNWDSPVIQADNPGVALPDTPLKPVIRTDLAGTNYVLQQYCIDEQPALWAAFVDAPSTEQYPDQVGDLSTTQPRSDWPLFSGAIFQSGSANAADTVANPNDNGYITAIEPAYAQQRQTPVASVKNASGHYVQPTPGNVESGLLHDTEGANGVEDLDFNGRGPNVYNPSTYSYMLVPTTGSDPGKGATLSAFLDYALTIGQEEAPTIGYASLSPWLERFGLHEVRRDVPGAVPPTTAELGALRCIQFTLRDVRRGTGTPSCAAPPAATPEAPVVLALPAGAAVVMALVYRSRRRLLRR